MKRHRVSALRCCPAGPLVAAYRFDQREATERHAGVQAKLTGELHSSLGIGGGLRGPSRDRVGPGDAVQEDGEHADGASPLGSVDATLVKATCDVELSEVERRATSPEQLGRDVHVPGAVDDLAQQCDAVGRISAQCAGEPDEQRRHQTVLGRRAFG